MEKLKQSEIVLYLLIICISIILALVMRGVVIRFGASDFEAFWVFGITIILCLAFLLALNRVIYKGIEWSIQKVGLKNNVEVGTIVTDDIKDLEPEDVNLDKIRDEYKTKQRLVEDERIQIAYAYTQRILAPHLTDDAMKDLLRNLCIYVNQEDLNRIRPIKTQGLIYSDLFHYGWNIWNHFGTTRNQLIIVRFLKLTFRDDLRSFEEDMSIKKKLRVDDPRAIIKIEHTIN